MAARARRRHPLGTLVVLLLLALVAYVGWTAAQVLLGARADDPLRGEAIVVLGAAQYDGRPSPALLRRLERALQLWEDDVAPVIVVTGGYRPGDRFTEATAARTWLHDRGVPEDRIRREVDSTNTYDQLSASTKVLADEGIDSAVLVSDGLHATRLRATADEVGLEATVAPATPALRQPGWPEALLRETTALGTGQLIGFRRLRNLRDTQGEAAAAVTVARSGGYRPASAE